MHKINKIVEIKLFIIYSDPNPTPATIYHCLNERLIRIHNNPFPDCHTAVRRDSPTYPQYTASRSRIRLWRRSNMCLWRHLRLLRLWRKIRRRRTPRWVNTTIHGMIRRWASTWRRDPILLRRTPHRRRYVTLILHRRTTLWRWNSSIHWLLARRWTALGRWDPSLLLLLFHIGAHWRRGH